jgi:hypothetical protein
MTDLPQHSTWLHNRTQDGWLPSFITNTIIFTAAAASTDAAAATDTFFVFISFHCAAFAATATAASRHSGDFYLFNPLAHSLQDFTIH